MALARAGGGPARGAGARRPRHVAAARARLPARGAGRAPCALDPRLHARPLDLPRHGPRRRAARRCGRGGGGDRDLRRLRRRRRDLRRAVRPAAARGGA
ncbi:hypothetical protein AB5I41_02995 [Sphingomonas sp. MMS24-JH45]